ncbi:GntR family transcriptional regulator [Aureimonas endophytica]|uniref:GntR family transcriptional regulator n=2 Tax=Aureimonas endophytica TaxID=2027858 RepID=A0A916ZT40_9HYPH|nr:GntR family transcriptional regulator [Aureimonas endophytica]
MAGEEAEAGGLADLPFALDRRLSMADQVHAALREAILTVRLSPGAAISENSICRQFAVSRTPVRAAIQRLGEEGLVEVFPQQGSFVSRIRLGGIHDSHFVRRTLEAQLLREAAARWTPAASRALSDSLDAQSADIARGDVDGFHRDDERFHQLIALQAGREGVWPTVLAAKTRLTRFIRFSGSPERLPVVVEEHRRIVEALDRGDAPAAEAALTAHLDKIFILFEHLPDEERRHYAP